VSQPPPDPVAFVQQQGNTLLEEAAKMREVALPSVHAAPSAWDAALINCRGKLDRLEAIMVQAASLRSSIRIGAREAAAVAREAFDSAATSEKQRFGARDYEAYKDREVRWNMASLQQQRMSRQWQNATDMADSVHDQIRLMHQGLGTVRQDIIAHLRHVTWESSLERAAS
jgi:hypothetical protein